MREDKHKLLIVSDYFYPHWTGISKSFYYLIQAIDKEIDCTVLTVNFNRKLPAEEKLFNTNIIRLSPTLSLSRSKYSILMIWRFLFLIKKYDTVLINSPSAHILPLAIITKIFRKKLLIFHQGDLILPKGVTNRIIEIIFDINSLISFSLADKVSTYTKDYAENSRILKHFLNKFTHLIFPILIETKTLKKKREKNIKFGFAGRFVEEKGFDILLEAIPLIIGKFPNSKFYYAGEIKMEYEDFFNKNIELFKKVEKYIIMLGLLDDEQMIDFYSLIDYIVVPSRSDCFNLVQAEAMKSGVPSIASDIPGLRVLVQKTGFGSLFENENNQALFNTVVEAIENRDLILSRYQEVKKILNNQCNIKIIKEFIVNKN